MNKIVTERTFYGGGGMLAEGSHAFILYRNYQTNFKGSWIYAKVVKMTDLTIHILPVHGPIKKVIRLYPTEIMIITDKDVPEEYVDRLYAGEIIHVDARLFVINNDITLREIPPEQMAEVIGLAVDNSFQILYKKEVIGHTHTNFLSKGGVYIEWAEISASHRGKHYYRSVLLRLMEHFNVEQLHFEASEDIKEMYQHLGAFVLSYDEDREMTRMAVRLRDLL